MIKVGVIFGGESVEHEVSIISAIQAMNKMDSEKYEIVPIYITKDGEWFTGDFLKEIETFQDMSLIKKYAKIKKGSVKGKNEIAGTLTEDQIREIAEIKLPDLNAYDVEAAIKIVKGTALNMGVEIK